MTGDQAGALREIVEATGTNPSGTGTTISITSGKGGVGKSNVAIFLAKALANTGKKILLFDGDLGLANLHILTGVSTPKNLTHCLNSSASVADVIYPVEDGIDLIPGGSGVTELADISSDRLKTVVTQLEEVSTHYDYTIVDGGAGIHKSVIDLAVAGDMMLLVLTPDPTSLADAYSALKVLASRGISEFYVVVNQVEHPKEGESVLKKLSLLTDKFLGITPQLLGELPRNRRLSSAIRDDRSLLAEKGLAEFSVKMNTIAAKINGCDNRDRTGFFKRLFRQD